MFHLYKGFKRTSTKTGFFVKGSAKIVEPPRIEYKGYKFKYNKKGNICRGLVIRQSYNIQRYDGSPIRFGANNVVLIKKKQNLKSKYLVGPTTLFLKRKKFKSLFPNLI